MVTLYPRQLTRSECNRYIDSENSVEPQPAPRQTLWQAHSHVVIGLPYFAFWIGAAIGFCWLGVQP